MIHYYCDGSFQEKEVIIACGIIRVNEIHTKSYFRYTVDIDWIWKHEEYAIYQTLLLIEQKKDTHVVIWNDGQQIVRALQTGKNKNNNDGFHVIMKKLLQLRDKGYIIDIQWKKEEESNYMKNAHDESRKYLEDAEIQQQIIEEKQNQEKTNAYKKENGLLTVNRKKLRKSVRILKAEKHINAYILQNSNEIHFKKISNKKWCACNEYYQAIYVHKNITEIVYRVLQESLQIKQTIKIPKECKGVLYSVLKMEKVKEQHPNFIIHMENWIETERIEFIS